jgi:hypothetical protein
MSSSVRRALGSDDPDGGVLSAIAPKLPAGQRLARRATTDVTPPGRGAPPAVRAPRLAQNRE